MEKKSSNLLETRRHLKRKKPVFLRQDGHKKKKLGLKWRRPKGLHNKIRLNKRGYRRNVSVGFKSPVEVRGLSQTGLQMVVVHNKNELQTITPKTQAIIIGKTVGVRKKLEIIKTSVEKKITILNLKDPLQYVKEVEDRYRKQREEKQQKEKEKKEEKKPEKKKEETTIDTIAEEETKKEEEKKEKDRILTKKV
jgi:large subunit ribosomal protein L32e